MVTYIEKPAELLLQDANKYLREQLNDYQIIICGESYENENKYNKLIKENSKGNYQQFSII